VKRRGLRFKLTLLYTAIFTILLGGFFLAANYLLANELDEAATGELVERATGLRGYIRFEAGRPTLIFDAEDPEVAFFVRSATRYFQIYDLSSGGVITQSPDLQFLKLQMSPAQLNSMAGFPIVSDVQTDQGMLRFFNDRIVSDSGRPYLVQVGMSLESVQLAGQKFRDLAFYLLPLGVLVAATAGWVMAGRTLSPIKNIVRTAQEIEVSQLNRRVPVTGSGDEIDQLAVAFNEAFTRLEKAVGEMQQFTASIAHELRTPLAALRGEAEMTLLHSMSLEECKTTLASQIEEFDKLSLMIHQLLTLAKAESGELKIEHKPVDVTALLQDLVETFSLLASEKRIALHLDSQPDLTIEGDRQWLERALINIVDNAIKYTPPGGRVDISGRPEGSVIAIDVVDTGQGISPEALPHIFERFYRADASRSKDIEGVGLGLSLVKWIVDQHNGMIRVTSDPGHGTHVSIHLPGNHN
jgi:two-component system OmpR family sensor kinase